MTKSTGQRAQRGSRIKFAEQAQGQYFCECGCGVEIQIAPDHANFGIPRFVIGHNARVSAAQHILHGVELRKAHGLAIAKEYEDGSGYHELAKKYQSSTKTIKDIVVELGGTSRPVGHTTSNQVGPNHPYWNGGTRVRSDGYRDIWIDPKDPLAVMRPKGSSYVPEHRLVMARHLGRPLRKGETVHHIDGDRLNNDISNLQLRQGKHGKGVVMQCLDCHSMNVQPVPLD